MDRSGRPHDSTFDGAPLATLPRSAGNAVAAAAFTRREFFAEIVERLRHAVPDDWRSFQHRGTMNLLKIFYENERIHYEVWTNSATGVIEIGLHFEDGPVSTAAYLTYFDAHIVEIKHQLGPEVELERWTASWGHLYELVPLTRLTDEVIEAVVARLAAFIATLQPLVAAADIPLERSAVPTEPRGPWRKWRRGRG